LVWLWQLFPVVTLFQWATDFYPQGKTSINSRFNIPGKIGWALMETPGFVVVLYCMFNLPKEQGIKELPAANWLMAGLFSTHYVYRAIISPLFLNPSMSPIHIIVWLAALCFQLINGASIGGYLAGYGPTTADDWAGRMLTVQIGVVVFVAGLIGNIIHDDELRAIRRNAAKSNAKGADKVYQVPSNGLFEYILYPHYFCEWVEWLGYWIIGGWACVPARNFLLNELATMTPRALSGRRWYIQKFGAEKIGNRKAVIPGVL